MNYAVTVTTTRRHYDGTTTVQTLKSFRIHSDLQVYSTKQQVIDTVLKMLTAGVSDGHTTFHVEVEEN